MMENSASNTGYQGPAAGRSPMTEELSGRRIVVPETRELDQLVRLLEERGATVSFHDPFIPTVREDGHVREGVDLTAEIVAATDAVVVVTDHKKVNYQLVMDNASLIVDSRNVTRKLVRTKARVVSLASTREQSESLQPV